MKNLLAAAAVATLALTPIAAHAEPGGHGQGHKKDQGHQDDRHDNGGAWNPPGLAKKPGGMPPGQ